MSTPAIASHTIARAHDAPARSAGGNPAHPYLTPSQARSLESELRFELAALERRLAADGVADPAVTSPFSPQGTEAGRRANETLGRRDAVADALDRLETGEYGTCSRCGDPIAYGRLLAIPETTHCLGCSGRA
jgi:DnaK suppressor protein